MPGKVGVYVDVANLTRNGGYGMRYDVLREFASRGGSQVVRANAYVVFDPERAGEDDGYRKAQDNFFSILRDFGYKVCPKHVRWYMDETGNRYGKANTDLEMAVDALLQSENLDRVLLATGDGDFIQVVTALQNRGCRVEVVAFDNVSSDLRREADMYLSGYLVPNLLPTSSSPRSGPAWGEVGSRVRGFCYSHSGKGYGFMRYVKRMHSELWITDTRHPDSAYESVFFHDSYLPREVSYTQLPSRNFIFEFELAESTNPNKEGVQAIDVKVVGRQQPPWMNGASRAASATAPPPATAPDSAEDQELDEPEELDEAAEA